MYMIWCGILRSFTQTQKHTAYRQVIRISIRLSDYLLDGVPDHLSDCVSDHRIICLIIY